MIKEAKETEPIHQDEKILVKALLLHLTLDFKDVKHLYHMIYNCGVFSHKTDDEIKSFLLSLGTQISCERQMRFMVG